MDDKMNVGIFLTKEEVAELTSFKRHAQQIRALRLMGLPFLVNPAGRPIVTRAAVVGGMMPSETPQGRKWQSSKVKRG